MLLVDELASFFMVNNDKKMRIAISGAGRIGRAVYRAYYENRSQFPHLQLVAMNDPHDFATLAHLLRYDSVHGRAPFEIVLDEKQQCLLVDQESVQLLASRDPAALPWSTLQVDCVLECTGHFKDAQGLNQHVQAGCQRVILSSPAKGDLDATVVLGANDADLSVDKRLISIGSCTTNALAPLLRVVQDWVAIEQCFFTTVHAYTKDQNLVDAHHSDLRRSRAAGQSIIPTKTGAAKTTALVLPELDGRISGYALRVPTANVSLLDMVLQLREPVTLAQVRARLIEAARHSSVFGVTDEPLVSCDFNHCDYSAVVDLTQIQVTNNTVRLVAWYDNEWAYAVRMLDVAQLLAEKQLVSQSTAVAAQDVHS